MKGNSHALKLLFFGKVPPPNTGMTVTTKTILDLIQDSDRFEVKIISSSLGYLRSETLMGAIIYYLRQILNIYRSIFALTRELKNQQYNVIYFAASSSLLGNVTDQLVSKIGKSKGLHVVAHLHNGNYYHSFTKFRFFRGGRKVVQFVDSFIFLSEGLYELSKEYIPREKITIIPNPIDVKLRCTEDELAKKWNRKETNQPIQVLYLANFIEEKGYLLLKRAVESLYHLGLEERLQVRFVGLWLSEQSKTEFLGAIDQSVAKKCFRHVGPIVDRTKVKEELLSADILCLPSFYPVEALPVSIIEAMNAGNAILSTFHAAIPEIVMNGEDGVLVEKRSVEALAYGLQNMLDRSVVSEMGQRARRHFMEKYHHCILREKLIDAFDPFTARKTSI